MLPIIHQSFYHLLSLRKFVVVFYFATIVAGGIFGQDCANSGTLKVDYYKNNKSSLHKLDNYFVPVCDSILSIDIKATDLHYRDPVSSSPPGYRFMILKELPKHDTISATRLKEWILLSDEGHPIFILPTNTISLSEIGRHIGFLESVYVVPVMLDNAVTNDIDSLFENDCVKLFTAESLKIYYPSFNLDYRENIEVGMIQFPGWQEELAITDFLDIKVTDELDQKINYSVYNNNTIWLDLQRKDAFYDFNLFGKESPYCRRAHHGNYPYPFPVVQLQIDSAYGKKGEEVCLPVTSKYFKSVSDFNLRFYWAKDSLQLNKVAGMHPHLYRIVQTGLFEVQEGYQELSINPKRDRQDTISIADGEVLFELCFIPLVEGPGEIPVRVRNHPYSTGDSLSFEIIGVPVDARANTGIITLLDEKYFKYDITPLCTSGDVDLYDFKLTIIGDNGPYTYSFNDPAVRDSTFTDSVIMIRDVPEGDYTFTVIDRHQ